MEESVLRKYLEAGRIAARVRREAMRMVEEGRPVKEICTRVEEMIVGLGGRPAFPCNISINDIAAHYTPRIDDESVVPAGAVVKIDIGVHVDGYIADTAVTVSLDPRYEGLLEAVQEALYRALKVVKPGTPFSEVGRVVQETLVSRGYKPIANLSGHSLDRYLVHAGESIPNIYEPRIPGVFTPGRAYAIEPFGTTGVGEVVDINLVTIYSLREGRGRRRVFPQDKRLLAAIASRFRTLPFTERWLVDLAPDVASLRRSLARLARMGLLREYPVLVERGRGVVAQYEHTIVVLNDNVIVTTEED